MEEHIIKYLTGTISESELNDLKDWAQTPENRKLFLCYVKTNQELDLVYGLIDADLAYMKVKESIASTKKVNRPFARVLKYAAAILLLVTIGVAVHFIFKDSVSLVENKIAIRLDNGDLEIIDENKKSEILDYKGDVIAQYDGSLLSYEPSLDVDKKNAHHELIVPYGKQFAVQLSDGSLVFVNSGSKLKFPIVLKGKNTRDIFLEGEAFFEVEKNKISPFIVHTKDMNVQVLGTKFNVSSYKDEKNTSVVLKEGKVGITKHDESFNQDNSIVITPGEKAILQEDTFLVNKVKVKKHIAWKDGYLFFENDKFESIVKKIERYYDIVIENDFKELNDVRFTGSFTEEPIDEVLDIFKEVIPFKYQVNGKKVVINSIVK